MCLDGLYRGHSAHKGEIRLRMTASDTVRERMRSLVTCPHPTPPVANFTACCMHALVYRSLTAKLHIRDGLHVLFTYSNRLLVLLIAQEDIGTLFASKKNWKRCKFLTRVGSGMTCVRTLK